MTTAMPVKFFPGFLLCEKSMPAFSNTNSFLLLLKPTKRCSYPAAAFGTSADYTHESGNYIHFLRTQIGSIPARPMTVMQG
jgi:hypothetical protein